VQNKTESQKSLMVLKNVLQEVKPSAVSEHKIDDKGIELKLHISTAKLTAAGTKDLVSLLMSDMM
jgi:hypothetical protein